MLRRLPLLLTAALVLVPAATARAAWFTAQPLDGPNADVVSVGNVDLARDGNGAVAYIRRIDGVPHAAVVRMVGGTWRAPERVDFAPGTATDVKVAAGDGNRLAVAWISNGMLYATVAPGGDAPGAFVPAVALGGPGVQSLDIDLGVNGAAYVVWQEGGNVFAARLQDATWTRLAAPLDIDPARQAGTGRLRPRVAVSAEGYAVATWGEWMPDGTSHVFGRRLTGLNLSMVPQDLGAATDSPDIDIEDDGSFAWIAFRQDIGGVSRTAARRLVGSLYEAPEMLDGGAPSDEPRVDMSGAGVGASVVQAGSGVFGMWLDHDHFQAPAWLGAGSTIASKPEVATSDRNDIAMAFRFGFPDGSSVARARYRGAEDSGFGGETTISRPDLGPVAEPGVFIGGDRVGDFAVAMVQGNPGARALTAAVYDRPPTAPFIASRLSYTRKTRPELRWRPGLELWSALTYRVYVDGAVIGQTTSDRLVPQVPLKAGTHHWQVEAVDRAGQATRSRLRTLRVDSLAPRLRVSVRGKRAAGQRLRISVSARDRGGSGMDHVTVDYGDRSRKSRSRRTTHRYRRGTYRLKVAAVDKAGNVARKQVRLRIARS